VSGALWFPAEARCIRAKKQRAQFALRLSCMAGCDGYTRTRATACRNATMPRFFSAEVMSTSG